MAPRAVIYGAIMGVVAPVLVLGASPQCMREGSCANDANDINSLLQVSVNTGKVASHKQVQAHQQEPISSLLDNTEFMCWEGPSDSMPNAVAYPRGCPMAQMDSHQGLVPASCAARGYTQSLASPDACYGAMGGSSFVRPGTTDAELGQFQSYVHGLIQANTQARNLSQEMGMMWASCLPCTGGAAGDQVFRWWGATRAYSASECATMNDEVLTAMRTVAPRVGAFESDTHVTCFEGEYDYIVASLARVQRTPFGDLFRNAVVHEGTCATIGYGTLRDLVDDCWPMASKHMHTETEDADIGQWVAGPRSTGNTHRAFDTAHGLPSGLAVNLTSCFGCQAGGPYRDRGMLMTMQGAGTNGGYFAPQCQALFDTACRDYPGALSQDLCAAGFSSVFHAEPLDPAPALR